MKTNGARFLESLGIAFELREYEVDPERSVRHHGGQEDRHARRAGLQNSADDRRRAAITSSPSFPATPSWTSRNSRAPQAGAKPRCLRSKTCSRSPATSAAASPSSAQRKPTRSSSMKPRSSSTDQRLRRNARHAVDPRARRLPARRRSASANPSRPPT